MNSLVPFQPFQLGRMKLRHGLRERHTHNATVIAQQGACNNYGQRYRGCTCCLMDTESLMIRRPFGSIDPNSIRETELHTECRRRREMESLNSPQHDRERDAARQSTAIIVHEAKRTATSTRTTHTRQNKPFQAAAVQQRRCPQLLSSLAVSAAVRTWCGGETSTSKRVRVTRCS